MFKLYIIKIRTQKMAERLNKNETQNQIESELVRDPNVDAVLVSEMGYTHSNRLPFIAESMSPKGVRQELKMLIEAGDQTFALSEVEVEGGKSARIISLVGKEEDDRARLVHFFDEDKPHPTIAIGRSFDARGLFGDDDLLSREHFSVSWDMDRIRVDDHESTNGTIVGVPKREKLPAKNTDEGVAMRGIKRLAGRRKAQKEAGPAQPPLSESPRWSVPGIEILDELGL